MILKHKPNGERGQGITEFAMVLPLLLLVLVGIAEFGRIFVIYSNLFNSAREGARYGIVHPRQVDGIVSRARDQIVLVDPAQVDVTVQFDSGPGTPTKDADAVRVGDRVVVTLYYDVQPMLPILRPLLQNLYVETVAARTVSSLRTAGGGGAGGGGGGGGGVPTLTFTPTFTPTSTPTSTPVSDVPIQIDTPLRAGDTTVSGSATPGQVVSLRDIQDSSLRLSTTVDENGRFLFRVDAGLVAGHVIVVEGYGETDWAIVEEAGTPTPTPTGTPTPTATPAGAYIVLVPNCGPEGDNTITVRGSNWASNKNLTLEHWFEGSERQSWAIDKNDIQNGSFETSITINASAGTHTIRASQAGGEQDSQDFEVPCVIPTPTTTSTPTPTPTPSYPNLIVESLALMNEGTISTYDPITFTVSVRNIGENSANNLFWVDLYIDPTNPISPTDPLAEESVDLAAVSSLEVDASISLTLSYQEGFTTTGDHVAYAMADTTNLVAESNELDNVSTPLTFTVSQEVPTPTPTPTPTPAPEPGAISGSTLLYLSGDVVPYGRANVYCYDGATLIAETISNQDGSYYLLENIPPGTYTVVGETYIDDVLYTDVVVNIVVVSGQETTSVTLILH